MRTMLHLKTVPFLMNQLKSNPILEHSFGSWKQAVQVEADFVCYQDSVRCLRNSTLPAVQHISITGSPMSIAEQNSSTLCMILWDS
jgi:hypothetical protein